MPAPNDRAIVHTAAGRSRIKKSRAGKDRWNDSAGRTKQGDRRAGPPAEYAVEPAWDYFAADDFGFGGTVVIFEYSKIAAAMPFS
jgi:hypothetical protein